MIQLLHGDCLQKLKELDDNSIDSIVTDPPYGLSFMGKKRDYDVPSQEIREECLRVLKPGGHLLAFAGTRTQHRMAVRIEDAGFEIRDMIAWVYGSGFPKSLNIGKAVDRIQGNDRKIIGPTIYPDGSKGRQTAKHFQGESLGGQSINTQGTSEREGRGTALKPSNEPVTRAQKPLNIVPINILYDITLYIMIIVWNKLSNAERVELISELENLEQRDDESLFVLVIAKGYHKISGQRKSGKTDMSKSQDDEKIILNIVELWKIVYDINFQKQNTFTTSMAIKLTTELKTLKGLILPSIQAYTTLEKSKVNEAQSSANIVEQILREELMSYPTTISVTELATFLSMLNIVNNAEKNFTVVEHIVNTVLQNATTILEEKITPSLEPITVVRKPLGESTIAKNVLKYGTGGINIDECRVGITNGEKPKGSGNKSNGPTGIDFHGGNKEAGNETSPLGRFPANFIHDGSDEVVDLFPDSKSGAMNGTYKNTMMQGKPGVRDGKEIHLVQKASSGSASRFFYCAKASKSERNKGCDELIILKENTSQKVVEQIKRHLQL